MMVRKTDGKDKCCCGTCRHHLLFDGSETIGVCKRFPPVLVPSSKYDSWRQELPQMATGDWCGEYSQRWLVRG